MGTVIHTNFRNATDDGLRKEMMLVSDYDLSLMLIEESNCILDKEKGLEDDEDLIRISAFALREASRRISAIGNGLDFVNKEHDGHLTLFKFTTHWKGCTGTFLELDYMQARKIIEKMEPYGDIYALMENLNEEGK